MKVTVQCIHCEVRNVFQERLKGMVNRLEDKYDWIIDGTIYFKEEKNDHKRSMVVEILLSIPGPDVFAKGQDESFELAANKAMAGIEHQLKKHKEKDFSHH